MDKCAGCLIKVPAATKNHINIVSNIKIDSDIVTSGSIELICDDLRSINSTLIVFNEILVPTDHIPNAHGDPAVDSVHSIDHIPIKDSPAAGPCTNKLVFDSIVGSTDAPISSDAPITNCYVSTVSSIGQVDFENGNLPDPLLYTDTHWCPSLRTVPIYDRSYDHYIGGLRSQMNLHTWLYELSFEEDDTLRQFLTDGISDGFKIVDTNCVIDGYHNDNYASALSGDAYSRVNATIKNELSEDKYVISDDIPYCVHSLGAVPKKDGNFRIITDCKRPLGASINNYMNETTHSFSTTLLTMLWKNYIRAHTWLRLTLLQLTVQYQWNHPSGVIRA